MKNYPKIFSLGAGAMDATTGVLLMIAPAQVLALLHLPAPSAEAAVLFSWVGAFVFSVGLSYAFVLKGGKAAETVWQMTALIRTVVAFFLAVKMAQGTLPWGWVTVAATDAVVAAIQIGGLRKQWWKEESR